MTQIPLQLAAEIDRMHGLLTTIFPVQELAVRGPSRIFLDGPLGKTLTDSVGQLRDLSDVELDISEVAARKMLNEFDEWAKILLTFNRKSDGRRCDFVVRMLFLINGINWDLVVEGKGASNLRPMNPMTPLEGIFLRVGEESQFGQTIEQLLDFFQTKRRSLG